MGRPPSEVDLALLKKLARIHCTQEEMADILGVSVDTLTRNFADAIKEARAHGRSSLRRKQFRIAERGNVGMLIWLGKQLLEQRDRAWQEHSGPGGKPIETTSLTDEQLEAQIKGLLEKANP